MKKHISTVSHMDQEVIGLDLSDRSSTFVAIDADSGEIVRDGKVATSKKELARQFGGRQRARIAIEAGSHSAWVARTLEGLGHEVIVANPRQVALIARSKHKNDRMDAIALARLARVDARLLYPISHRGEAAQLDLSLMRSRDFLVTNRTRMINFIRSLAKSQGEPLPRCSSEAFPERARAAMPSELREIAEDHLKNIAAATAQIQAVDRKLEKLSEEKYPEALKLRQINGVGPLTSLAFVLTLEEPSRFRTSRDVGAYLGLVPGQRQSGASNPQMHITRAGDPFLRKLLIQAAHYMLGPFGKESDLRTWGLRRAGQQGTRKGAPEAKKKAVTAVARKLAVLMHSLWRQGKAGEPYVPVGYRGRRQAQTHA